MKEKIKNYLKKVGTFCVILLALVLGYFVGQNKPEKIENNYVHSFSPKEISIALNENNDLIMIERKTGKYKVYSDEIGMIVFKMYANRIKQQHE